MRKTFPLYSFVLLMVTVATAGQMYKCPDVKGGSVYRNLPCAGTPQEPPPEVSPDFSASEWAALCKESGRSAYEIAAARDRGITSAHLIALMEQSMPDPARHALLASYRAVILELYSKPHITPTGAKDGIEIKCLSERTAP